MTARDGIAHVGYKPYVSQTEPYEVVIELFNSITDRNPVEVVTARYESLGDALTHVANAVNNRRLDGMTVAIESNGKFGGRQP